jgi:ribose 5-phosphate isomerase B
MKIAIGSDHGGVELKSALISYAKSLGHKTVDMGTDSSESCDYPDFGYKVAEAVSKKRVNRGILACKSGIGMAIVANKISGVRAGVLNNLKEAVLSRRHNDLNVAVFSGSFMGPKEAKKILRKWLNTEFEGGRHKRRLDKIRKIEKRGRI